MDILPKSRSRVLAIFSAISRLLRPLNTFNLFLFTLYTVLFAGAQGFEPQLPGPKPGVLPLYYAPNFCYTTYA